MAKNALKDKLLLEKIFAVFFLLAGVNAQLPHPAGHTLPRNPHVSFGWEVPTICLALATFIALICKCFVCNSRGERNDRTPMLIFDSSVANQVAIAITEQWYRRAGA